jgi:quercetin dioxygenase-like cupin family protein
MSCAAIRPRFLDDANGDPYNAAYLEGRSVKEEGLVFSKHGSEGYGDALPGIRRKTLAHGERTLMTEFVMSANSALPDHSHPYEQTGYLVEGRMTLRIGNEKFEVARGDSWCIPMNVQHGAQILEDCVAVEVFSPVREDYLPQGCGGQAIASKIAIKP